MKKILILTSFLVTTGTVFAQLKTTSSAIVAFDASTSVDNLPKAENKTVYAELDTKTGAVAFEAAVKNFAFSNPSMQQHFNGSKWMNSDTYTSFTFTGKISDLSKVNFTKNGTYTVRVTGDLTIRNVTKPLTTTATITVKGTVIGAASSFSFKLSDYGITNVSIDAGKISNEPKVTVTADLK